jgi:DtxR family transcriptional regulator, Mn-dependent transcriptional regulator
MRANLTETVEDYLKAIYEITSSGERASTNQIAAALGVTPASVTGMIKKLSSGNAPLLDYQKSRGVTLTPEGEQFALEIVRHHRLLEMYLHRTLGFEWDMVHDEADRLEHVISEEFEERIDDALGHPSHDPHGDPIPSRDLHVPDTPTLALARLRPTQSARVHRVGSSEPELLRYLSDVGLVPQVLVSVLDYSPFDDNLTLAVEGRPDSLILGKRITSQVFVELIR